MRFMFPLYRIKSVMFVKYNKITKLNVSIIICVRGNVEEDFSANLRDGSEVECWVDDNYNGRRRLRNDSEGRGVQVT